jgi:hypothetical protein
MRQKQPTGTKGDFSSYKISTFKSTTFCFLVVRAILKLERLNSMHLSETELNF